MLATRAYAALESLYRRSRLAGGLVFGLIYGLKSVDAFLAWVLLALWLIFVALPLRLLTPRKHEPVSSRTLRVLFLSYEGFAVAPARVRAYYFSRALARCGIETEVFAFWDHYFRFGGFPTRPGIEIQKIWAALITYHRLRRRAFDVVYHQRPNFDLIVSLALGWIDGVRTVWDIDDWIFNYWVLFPLRFRTVIRWFSSRADACIVASQPLLDECSRHFTSVHLVPTFVDTDQFIVKPNAQGSPRDASDPVVFGWNGTLFQYYTYESAVLAVRVLARAFDRLKDGPKVELQIAGGGAYLSRLSEEIRKNYSAYPIRLMGWVAPAAMPDYLTSIDVGLYFLSLSAGHSVRSKHDEMIRFQLSKSPTKLFEYMASAKPVLITNVGEAPRYVENGEVGYVGRSEEELVDAAVRLASDPALRERMGKRARIVCEESFSLKAAADRLERIISSLRGRGTP